MDDRTVATCKNGEATPLGGFQCTCEQSPLSRVPQHITSHHIAVQPLHSPYLHLYPRLKECLRSLTTSNTIL